MATAEGTWCPTPTSLTLIRPVAESDEGSDPQTFVETIQAIKTAPEPEIEDSTRFRPLRLFATGGQGLVYVAHDKQLGREVALKELKPRSADRRITRHRFIREAEITGSLEHPGIVPVYALGRHADGRPYYAMRLIQGRTLHDAVQHFYAPELKVSEVDRNLLFRKLLQRFVSVCQTVAYAHSRGIIHRDLKPANVLLGQYGEALVADWGLARPFHPTDGCNADIETLTEVDTTESPSNETLMGSAVGTPAYMSPEQSEGRWDKVGPTSDVYSLGATLYTILTGQTPIPKMPWPDAYRRIMAGDFPSPKQLNPSAPRGLVAICRKAMSIKQDQRYQSALALAEDVEHWLADEPVTAEPAPMAERVSRWIRRHKTLVWAMCVLSVTASLALTVGLFVVEGWRTTTEQAFSQTRTALDRTQSVVVDELLGKQRELTPEHRKYLQDALLDYERLAAQTGRDPATQLAVARAYRRSGEIRLRLGEVREAKLALAEAAKYIQSLPLIAVTSEELGHLHVAQGSLAIADGNKVAAEDHFANALNLFRQLEAARPTDITLKKLLAAAYNNRGAVLKQLDRPADAVAAFQSALELLKFIATERKDNDDDAKALAGGHENLGECLSWQSHLAVENAKSLQSSGSLEEAEAKRLEAARLHEVAEQNLVHAGDIAQRLVNRSPGFLPFHEQLASVSQKLGRLYFRNNRWSDARLWLKTASVQYEKLSDHYPNVPELRLEYGSALTNLGRCEIFMKGSPYQAIAYFDRALEILVALSTREVTVRCDDIIAAAYAGRAEALALAGNSTEAADAYLVAAMARPSKANSYKFHSAFQRLQSGHVQEGIELANQIATQANLDQGTTYNCACLFAQASAIDRDRSEEHKRRAVQLLRAVFVQGSAKCQITLEILDSDVDLNPIRDFPEFVEFRRQLK